MRILLKTASLFALIFMFAFGATAQTTIISPTGDGGFETGTDFASNGWTVANGTVTNKWFLGTVPSGFTNRAAYISNDAAGATWTYTNTAISVVHFYRQVTFPAGQTDITLSFDWAALGETGSFDALMVSLAPTTYTPTASTTSLSTGTLASPAVTISQQLWTSSTVQTATIKIPRAVAGNCSAATTMLLIFTWKNDGSGGSNPPGGIDNISLTSQAVPVGRITAAGGTFTINPGLPNTGTNFSTFTEAVNSLNAASCTPLTNPVTFNVAANQTFSETVPAITASGSATGHIVFQKSGSGANPNVMRSDPGTITTSAMGGQGDGIIVVDGGDYITFNGIDVSASDQGIEYGYFLRKAAGTDGCKNDTIKNAAITMTRGTSVYVTGIYSSNLDASSAVNSATGVTVSSTGGRNENITITGTTISNVFYGMQLRGFAAATPYDFYDQNFVVGSAGAGNGNTINNFGGNGTTVAYGIYVLQQNNTAVNYNTIVNTDNGGISSTGTMYGIYMSTGTTSVFTANFNTITLTSAYTSGSLYGIYNSAGTGNLTVNNNAVSLNNTVSSSGTFGFIYNASATAATAVSFSNNTFITSSLTSTGTIYLIFNSVTNAAITTVQNNSTPGTFTTAGAAATYCYYISSSPTGTDIFSGNNFSNITVGGSFYGYYTSAAAAHRRNAFNNTFSTIIAGGTTMYGIYKSTGISNIYKNKIADFTSNATTSSVYGIYIPGGTKDSVYNNIIGDLKAPSASTATNAVVGIYIGSSTAASTVGVYYNTVYLSANSGGANFGTSAIYVVGSATATTAALEMKNNIFVNNSQPNGTGIVAVYRRSNTSLPNYTSSSNNNLFYTASPGANALIYYDGTNSDQTLADFKTRVSPRETNSVSENPPFISVNPTDVTYLHISPSSPTQIESGGSPVSGITDDFDGNARNAGNPDIGADEFAGIGIDLSGPSINYTPLLSSCTAGDRTVTGITITDASGVPVSGTLVPRIYYRKGVGTWYSKPGTLSSGTGTNGTWSFTIVAADMGGVVFGDVISYYIIAQDVASTPNISSNPSGATASNVNTVTVHPASPNTYIVGTSLTGSYNVGGANVLKTLTNAVDIYNGCPVAGPVTFNLTDASYPENFPIIIGLNSAASAVNTLTIRPAGAVAVNISGTSGTGNPSSILRLDHAKYVKIDGINTGGSSLSFENTSTVAGSAVIWLSSQGVGLGATNNTIKGVGIKGGITQNTSANATYGIVIAGNALNSAIASVVAGDDNDNNTIDSCSFSTVRYGIFTRGGATTNPNLGTVIQKNIIGPTSFGTEEIGKGGIVVREEDGIVITRNEIRYVGGDYSNTTGGVDRVGIALQPDAAWPPTSAYIKNATVTRNLIHDIVEERTFAAAGIGFAAVDSTGGTGVTNNVIANNMIYNILANGTGADQGTGIGIGAGNGDKIVYNSIYMTGDADPTAASTAQATSAFGINITSSISATAVSNPTILNNIVYMDLTASRATAIKNACVTIPASYVWGTGTMNYNDWYISGSNTQAYIGATGGSGGTFYNTLPAWQTASAKDANSKSVDPQFITQTDLHLQPSSPLDLQATPVAGVTTDFDGQTRDASVPDMGADEINLNNCTGAVGGTITPVTTTICATDSTIINGSGFSTGSTSGYQWQSSPNNSTWTDIAGSVSPGSLNTHGLTATTYFRLKVTCGSGTAIAYSNVLTITVNPLPTISITPTGTITLCSPSTQVLNLSATSAVSPSYQWQVNGTDISGGNGTSYTATASGNYRLKVTNGSTSCSNTSAVVNITINPQPSAIGITPSSVTMCSTTGSAVLLTSSGGTISSELIVGTQTNQNTASTSATGYPSPFSNYYGGNRHQFLVLASELSTAGFTSGAPINSLNFPVVSLGTTFTNNQNFKVKVGHSTLTSLTTFVAGLSTVYGPATFTPAAGYNNVITFTTPFTWNGTDNIIIETTYSNANLGGTSDVVVMYNSPTSFQSTLVYRVDNTDAATVESATTISYSYSARPDFTLSGSIPTTITWAPTAGLFTNAAATLPYTGTAATSVYAKPSATITYTATAASAANCTRTQTVTVTQNCITPVTLLNFKGEKSGSINKLDWTTATEINNAGFELQRSADGQNFSKLVYVVSKANNGNSTSQITYGFDDVKPLAGNGYYRLKQIDKDGKATYSQVVLIKGAKVNMITIISIYPNPVEANLNMIIASPTLETITLIVTDLSGKLVKQQQAKVVIGDNQLQIHVSNFASGTYLIKAVCANGCETWVQKFVKE
jgi:hypothetical protein